MDVVRLHGPGDLRFSLEPEPSPGEGEVLIEIRATGICGSDLHWFQSGAIGDAKLDQPLVLGHEFAGVVRSQQSQYAQQRVAVDPAIPCLRCEYCLEGNPNLCASLRFAGHAAQDGSLRQFVAWPERCLYPLPDQISLEEGALLEPLGVAIHAVNLSQLQPGMKVGVFGCGTIGLLIIQLARLSGVEEIIATDRYTHRLEAACHFGAKQLFPVDEDWSDERVWSATGGSGVAVAFEVAGANPTVEAAVAAARPGGKVVLIGIPETDRTAFTASIARRKGLSLQLVRRMKHTYPRAIQLTINHQVDLKSLITHHFPLSQAEQAFQVAVRYEGIKVIIES
jgi:L-iditol 2-dehydrogenase